MNAEYIRFYPNKSRLLLLIPLCIAAAVIFYQMTTTDISADEKLLAFLGSIMCILYSIRFCFDIFRKKAFIEISPTYIIINYSEKLQWEDIVSIKTIYIIKNTFFTRAIRFLTGCQYSWSLEVKDLSKYHLTYSQKNMLKSGLSPFMIAPSYLSKHDHEQLKNILKQRIPQNDLD